MGKYRKSIVSLTSLFTFISLQRRKHCPCLSLVLNPFKSWSASMQCATGYDLTSLYMVFQCCISVIHKYRGGKMSAVKWSLTAYQLSSLCFWRTCIQRHRQAQWRAVWVFQALGSFHPSICQSTLACFLSFWVDIATYKHAARKAFMSVYLTQYSKAETFYMLSSSDWYK